MKLFRTLCLLLLLVPGLALASETCERNCAEISVDAATRQIIVKGPDGSDLYVDFVQSERGSESTRLLSPKTRVVPLDDLASLQQLENARTTVVTHQMPGGGSITIVSVFNNSTLISQTVIMVSRDGIVRVEIMPV